MGISLKIFKFAQNELEEYKLEAETELAAIEEDLDELKDSIYFHVKNGEITPNYESCITHVLDKLIQTSAPKGYVELRAITTLYILEQIYGPISYDKKTRGALAQRLCNKLKLEKADEFGYYRYCYKGATEGFRAVNKISVLRIYSKLLAEEFDLDTYSPAPDTMRNSEILEVLSSLEKVRKVISEEFERLSK